MPQGLAVVADGTLYIADSGNRVRRVGADGRIRTVAGTGLAGSLPATRPRHDGHAQQPGGAGAGLPGNLYISRSRGNRIRRLAADGTINTVAGNGVEGYLRRRRPARAAQMTGRARWPSMPAATC